MVKLNGCLGWNVAHNKNQSSITLKHNAIFDVTLDGWNMIGFIKGEENLWNYEHVINNLILHL
jgi:hypothetical protein